jgi:hypothetical protein
VPKNIEIIEEGKAQYCLYSVSAVSKGVNPSTSFLYLIKCDLQLKLIHEHSLEKGSVPVSIALVINLCGHKTDPEFVFTIKSNMSEIQ